MDADNAICIGCFRTLDEIAQWSRADDSRKLAILAAVDKRRAEHDPAVGDSRGESERHDR
jgi:predicted Fe-S protein YdhL (DUF1289 family)